MLETTAQFCCKVNKNVFLIVICLGLKRPNSESENPQKVVKLMAVKAEVICHDSHCEKLWQDHKITH
jgi:hypothetical protein